MESIVDDDGGIRYDSNKPIVPDGKMPSGRNGATSVYVSIYIHIHVHILVSFDLLVFIFILLLIYIYIYLG